MSATENSFDEVPIAIAEKGFGFLSGSPSPPLSRSTSSSSFTRRSWTELKADTNISDEEFDQWGKVGAEQSRPFRADFSDSDSTFGAFADASDAFKRNLAKVALFGIIIAMVFGKNSVKIEEMSEENATKLRMELDKMVAERWEFELKLVQLREQLESERALRSETEKKLWRAHEQLETELNDRIRLETELGKTRAELTEAEEKVADAQREADEKWMGGGGLDALSKAYRKIKQREWARGDLKETSEWWVPLFWRVVRLTFFKER